MMLTDFLLARIAEREVDARVLAEGDPDDLDGYAISFRMERVGQLVLAECEATRRLIGEHERHPTGHCVTCTPPDHSWCDYEPDFAKWPCPTLRLLAAVDADHAEYDEAWLPT